MITRAIVVDILKGEGKDPTKFKVRMPIFDNIETAKEYTENRDLSLAIACLSPDVSNSIDIGDAVYVGFEDNDISRPVILGHLYNQNKSNRNTLTDIRARSISVKNLNVTQALDLPIGTNIGEISYGDLLEAIQKVKKINI